MAEVGGWLAYVGWFEESDPLWVDDDTYLSLVFEGWVEARDELLKVLAEMADHPCKRCRRQGRRAAAVLRAAAVGEPAAVDVEGMHYRVWPLTDGQVAAHEHVLAGGDWMGVFTGG